MKLKGKQKLTVLVAFANDKSIEIRDEDKITAWKSTFEKEEYYIEPVVSGSIVGSPELQARPIFALMGLFGHSDWFTVNAKYEEVYKVSSIVSLEELD